MRKEPNPYAPPSAVIVVSQLDVEGLRGLGRFCSVVFALQVAALSIDLLAQIFVDLGVTGAAHLSDLVARSAAVAFVVGFVAFLAWVRRATLNLRAIGRPTFASPTTSVICFLVPFASFVLSFFVLRGLVRSSVPKAKGFERHAVSIWWLALFVDFGIAPFRKAFRFYSGPGYLATDVLCQSLAIALFSVALVSITIVIRAVAKSQECLSAEAELSPR